MIVGNYNAYIDGTTSNENIAVRLNYAALHYRGSNRSAVYTELYYKRTNSGFTTYGTGTFTVSIYDPVTGTTQSKSVTATVSITDADWVKVAEFPYVYVSHKDDGTGTAQITVSGSIPGTTLTSTSLSKSVSLGTIPRETSIDSVSCNTSYFTGILTYKYTPKSSALYNRCNIALDIGGEYTAVKTVNLGQKSTSQQTATVTLSSSELETIYKKLPSAKTGKLRFTFRTYSDSGYSTQVGDAGYKEISLTIPNDTTTQPTMTMTLAPVNDSSSLGTLYAKGISKVKATFTSGAGKYGATIASYTMTVLGKDYASPYTSDYITSTGTVEVKGTVKDSRGYSRTYTQSITVLDYTAPSISSLVCNTTYFNGTLTYKYTPPNSTFYPRCVVTIGSTTIKTISPARASGLQTATLTFSDSELSTIYNLFPSSSSGTLKMTFRAYTDSGYTKQIGADSSKEITLSIPDIDATRPTMTMALSPVSDFTSTSAIYVKGLSKVKATFTSGAGKYGATISSYKLTVLGKDYASPYTSDYIATVGSITVTGTVTDTRGFSRTYTQNITVLDFTKPAMGSVTCNTGNFNGTITYQYTPANSSFYSRCVVTLGSTTIKTISLGQKAASQQTSTLTLSESELSTIYNAFPNGTSGTLKFTFRAYINSGYSEQIGTDSSKEITLSIPNIDATQPTATLTITPESSLASPFNTLYIKGKSQATATLASGAGKYGATIKSYKVTIGAQSGNSPLTSDVLVTAGDLKITGTVTDSRGFSRTYEQTISVIDHSAPRILPISGQSSVIAARCNAAGELDSNGTGLLIAAKRSYSKVDYNDSQKNYCAIQFRYKEDGGSYSSWVDILARTATTDEVLVGPVANVTLDTLKTYMVQIRAIDDLGEAGSTTIFVSTEKVYMHRSGRLNSIAIGKYAEEENTVDIGEDMTTIFRGDVQFKSEAWVELPLGTSVAASTVNSGRWGGTGVFYRVCAGGKHIYVAFNISFTTSSSTVRAESYTIPYPPTYDVYALCPVGFSDGSRGIATVSISPKGRVNIYAVHKLPGATLSTGETVKWIDGYIDYWT